VSGKTRGGAGERAALKRGLAGGVRREVRPEERLALAALRPDAQTQALLDALPTAANPAVSEPDPHLASSTPVDTRIGQPRGALSDAPADGPRPGDALTDGAGPVAGPAATGQAAPGAARPIELVPIVDVAPSPHQARRHFAGVDDLARSIADGGLQHPILVRRNRPGAGTPYTLVFGERRHRAYLLLSRDGNPSVRAQYEHIPAFVLAPDELSDARLAVLTAEENAQRAGLTAWELAQNVVRLKAALDAAAARPVSFEQLARHFQLQAGSTNEYYTIGAALPEAALREAGLVSGDDVDWARVAQLKKQRLLGIARRPPAERAALLRAYAGLHDAPRRRAAGPRYSVDRLRTEGGFAMKIEKPVSTASYTRTQGESFLRDLEPALALLAEIAGDGGPAYAPDMPNLPGTYLVLRDRPENLSADDRRRALAVVEGLRRALSPDEPPDRRTR